MAKLIENKSKSTDRAIWNAKLSHHDVASGVFWVDPS